MSRDAAVAIDEKAATVTSGFSLAALWIRGVVWLSVYYALMGTCTEETMASGFKGTSTGAAEVQSSSQVSCRAVYADRVAERVEQLALGRMKQSRRELWSVRQQRLWASDVSGRLCNFRSSRLSEWILWEWWVEIAEVRTGGIDQRVFNSEAGHSPMASLVNGQGAEGMVVVAFKCGLPVAVIGVVTGMLTCQMYLWSLLCWMVCKQRVQCLLLLLLALLPGASGMEGSSEEPVMSSAVPVAVAALVSMVVGVDGFPHWFDLGAWVAEKDAWELEWGRLVDWVGGQDEACIQLVGLEARLHEGYVYLDFLKERAVPSAFLANFGRPAKSVCVCVRDVFQTL